MNDFQRIENVLSHLKKSARALSIELGLKNPQVFYDIKAGKCGISKDLALKLQDKYFINAAWLLTGDGEMLKEGAGDGSGRGSRIRYWVDVDATAGGVELFDDMTTNRFIDLSIPEFRDCTDAVNLYGDSMMPLYRNGQIIILKEWKENFIDFGNVYLVITCNGNRMVKYLRRGSDADHVLCISENKDFDPFEIERKDILRLYLVKGGISKNTL